MPVYIIRTFRKERQRSGVEKLNKLTKKRPRWVAFLYLVGPTN